MRKLKALKLKISQLKAWSPKDKVMKTVDAFGCYSWCGFLFVVVSDPEEEQRLQKRRLP